MEDRPHSRMPSPGPDSGASRAPQRRLGTLLLNLDKPLKHATLHNEFCALVPKPVGTRLKPLGHLGREGGWFRVTTPAQAHVTAAALLPDATLTRCPRC